MRVEKITIFLFILHPNYYSKGPTFYNYYMRFSKFDFQKLLILENSRMATKLNTNYKLIRATIVVNSLF